MRIDTVGVDISANVTQSSWVVSMKLELVTTFTVTERADKVPIDFGINSLESLMHCANNVEPLLCKGIGAQVGEFPFSVITTLTYPYLEEAH